ncbi:MAG: hypothetical protein KAS12_03480 [Candidatus Aenigmarchaeota archaeon]|nr:hypothetical protein [Candidatus Aenigmarchaeota archaeon]
MEAKIVFDLIKKEMFEQSLYSETDFIDLVDGTISRLISSGEMTQDEDNESLRETLETMWQENKTI